ncbi:hypothetical protein [Senegalimassilia anaerobia]|uniref:hypothetical protein n=1 Tax=Senegalimassilia anaerobia TaxID=1473216 RepID=UPI003A8E9C23
MSAMFCTLLKPLLCPNAQVGDADARRSRDTRRVCRIADTSISLGKCGDASAQTLQIPTGGRQSAADTWGRRVIRPEEIALYFRPAEFCLRRKNRSFCPPVAKTSDSCPLTRYVVDLFDDFLLIESHFFQTPHFYGLYPAKNRSSCPEAAKMNDSSQLTKENARFGHDRLKWASFALCIAAHLGSYRSSNLNGAVEA